MFLSSVILSQQKRKAANTPVKERPMHAGGFGAPRWLVRRTDNTDALAHPTVEGPGVPTPTAQHRSQGFPGQWTAYDYSGSSRVPRAGTCYCLQISDGGMASHLEAGSGISGTFCLLTIPILIPFSRLRGSQVQDCPVPDSQTGNHFPSPHNSLRPLFLGPLLSTGGYSSTTPSSERQIRFL